MLPKRIVAIGASTVYGRVDPEGGGFVTRLRRWHEEKSRDHAVFNLGVGGDTSDDVLRRLIPECSVRRPDLIIISVGMNDARREESKAAPTKTSPQVFESNFNRLIVSARNLSSVIVVGIHPVRESVTSPLGGRDWFFLQKDINQFAEITKSLCGKLFTPYVDIIGKWQPQFTEQYLHSDGLHLNGAGHEFVFKNVTDTILSVFRSE